MQLISVFDGRGGRAIGVGKAEQLIESVDWHARRIQSGSAERIGPALQALLVAESSADAEAAYWMLENHVVAQGAVYDAAEPAVSVLVAALDEAHPAHVRAVILGLMYEVVAGYPADGTETALIHRCRAKCRRAVWSLVREVVVGHHDAAVDILGILIGAKSGYAGSPGVERE